MVPSLAQVITIFEALAWLAVLEVPPILFEMVQHDRTLCLRLAPHYIDGHGVFTLDLPPLLVLTFALVGAYPRASAGRGLSGGVRALMPAKPANTEKAFSRMI
jgi:hypothetical protein